MVLAHVEFSRCLQDFDAHLKAEEKLVDLKQAAAGVPAQGRGFSWRQIPNPDHRQDVDYQRQESSQGSRAHLPVHSIGVVGVEVLYPFLQLVAALALLNAEVEQLNVGVQGELVHGVHATHLVEDGEKDGGPLGTRSVGLRRQETKEETRHQWRRQMAASVSQSPVSVLASCILSLSQFIEPLSRLE